MNSAALTIRARLTLLYFLVLAASFVVFFWICDFGFRRSIEATVNDASRSNLERIRTLIARSASRGVPAIQNQLTELSNLWPNGAIFQVADSGGHWIFRAPRFLFPQSPFPPPSENPTLFTNNLDRLQYRITRQRVYVDGRPFLIDAAVPTEPFDQALDNFRAIEKELLPLLVLLASSLGYWLSGRALAPVNRIIATARTIGVQNLSARLELPRAKDELRTLTETVNAMLNRVESSVKRITQFTADASHDLRTPLTLIRTNAELALRRPRSESEYRETLSRILAVSEQCGQLIENLLTLARADAEAAQLKYDSINLSVGLSAILQQARLLASSKGLIFCEQLTTDSLPILADESAIERMVLAIVDNAVKYTPAGGHVYLRSYAEEQHAVVEVEDTGAGIAQTDLPRIFDRFFRADQARSREIGGSGLGLSIARWIAEMHAATIEVTSQLGHGSLFRIRLPLLSSSSHPSNNIRHALAAVAESLT